MIEHQGVWLPAGEKHLSEWMTKNGEVVDGKGTYQIRKLRAAVAHCHNFRTAVDVGAHVGMWTMQLAKRFKNVHCFEPVQAHRECLLKNVEVTGWIAYNRRPEGAVEGKAVYLHPCALGDHEGFVEIETAPTSSGDSRVDIKVAVGTIPLKTLDSFQLQDVDFIKLDCEGYELFALKGGEELIWRCRPVVIVEQKPGRAQRFGLPERGAVDFLQQHGYQQVLELGGDFIMVPTS